MLNRGAYVFCAYRGSILSFHQPAGLSLTHFFLMGARLAPNRKKCSVVSVSRPAAWGRHPRPRLPAGLGALIRRYRPFLPYRPAPPYPCLSVRRLISGTVRSSAAAVPHPVSAFVRSQSPPGEAAGGTGRSCPTAVPHPISAPACSVPFPVLPVPALPCPPARLVLSFGLLSAAVGRRGFRSLRKASLRNARNLVRVCRRASCPGGTVDR